MDVKHQNHRRLSAAHAVMHLQTILEIQTLC